VTEAKSRLCELIEKARHTGPQQITHHGKSAVIVVDAALWQRIGRRKQRGNVADFIMASPLRRSGLETRRLKGGMRKVDL